MEIKFDAPLTSYQLKTNDTAVFLDVLACTDSSLVGLKLENCTVVQMHPCEFLSLTKRLYGEGAAWSMKDQLLHHGVLQEDEPLILLETIGHFPRQNILNALKLYKGVDIYSIDMIAYRYDSKSKRFWHGGIGKFLNLYYHPINEVPALYSLTEEEKAEFSQWYTNHIELISKKVSPRFCEILQLYFESYRIGRMNASFVMLFVILEMLYSDKGSKIAKSIAKGVSNYLGEDKEDRGHISSAIYTLYNRRSRYVHDGESVEVQDLFDLREYVRRVIIKIFEQGCDDGVLNFAESPKLIYKVNISDLCKEQNIELSELSNSTQINNESLEKIASGKYDISLSQAIRIAKALNKSVEQVFIMN